VYIVTIYALYRGCYVEGGKPQAVWTLIRPSVVM